MMFDLQTLLSDQQSIAQVAGSYLSTNAIDLWAGNTAVPTVPLANFAVQAGGAVLVDPGAGARAELVAQVTTTVTSGGAATVQFQLITADDNALSVNLTIVDQTDIIALATLVAGYRARLRIPAMGSVRRFLGLRYVIATATTTAGKVTAGLVSDSQQTFSG